MIRATSIRSASAIAMTVLLAAIAAGARAQTSPIKPSAAVPAASSLPAAQPTTGITVPQPAAAEPVASHVSVDFVDGKLDVDATNASLNGILHEVSLKTGIRVTGGVTEERVFGHYGPSATALVLASLLDGTGSNMLLVDDANGKSELVLTPRRGGATPPNPNAAAQASNNDEQGQQRYVPPIRPFQPPVYTGRGPLRPNSEGFPGGGQSAPPPTPDPNQPGDGSQTQQQSPQNQ